MTGLCMIHRTYDKGCRICNLPTPISKDDEIGQRIIPPSADLVQRGTTPRSLPEDALAYEIVEALNESVQSRQRPPSHFVLAGWNEYSAEAFLDNAPAILFEECKRAFFAGACHLLEVIVEQIQTTPEEIAQDTLNSIREELLSYIRTQETEIDQ